MVFFHGGDAYAIRRSPAPSNGPFLLIAMLGRIAL